MGYYYCCLRRELLTSGIAALLLGVVQAASAQSVTLSWNANPEHDVAGYRLHYGTAPRVYTQHINVGRLTTATVSSLLGGTTYFFALTAYNTAGFESLFSNGVPYTIPSGTPPPVPTPTPLATATPNPTVTPTPPPSTAQDHFNRPDGELGPDWTIDPTWGDGLLISGNKVITASMGLQTASTGVHYWNARSFGANQYSQIRLTGVVGSWSAVLVRGNLRPGPYYMVTVKPDGAYLYVWSNGFFAQLAHDVTAWATGDVLRLEVNTVAPNTARLKIYRNGSALFSYDDAVHFVASGQPGIGLHDLAGSMSLDDWEGGDLP
jgi:hypothetical protein